RGQWTGARAGRRRADSGGHRSSEHARASDATLRRTRNDGSARGRWRSNGNGHARRHHDSPVRAARVKVLIVDDEPLARRGLRRELDRIPDTTCVGECATRDEAVAAIVQRRPDLVLLDVQLGRATGFEVIERVGVESMPLVVFVTAYDRHALRAFEVHAVDYVLKPVDPDRLRDALLRAGRLRSLEQGASLVERLEGLLAAQSSTREPRAISTTDRIVVQQGTRRAFVDIQAIEWIEAYGNYV